MPAVLRIGVAISVFSLVVADVHANFALVQGVLAWALFPVAILGLVIARRNGPPSEKRVVTTLLVGALVTLVVTTIGYRTAFDRARDASMTTVQEQVSDRSAFRATTRFVSLCRSARDTARALARTSPVAVAVEGSDAQDYVSRAFDALAQVELPRAHPRGTPGTTLYDALRRPVAWSGENIALEEVLARYERVPDSDLFVFEQGVYTYLIAVEPLLSRRGFVSVEIPLAADRRLQNRYLEDYDAISSWLGRSADTEFLTFGDEREAVQALLPTEKDVYWDGSRDTPRLYFALRAPTGELLGVSSVAGESPVIVRREARRRYKLAAAVALAASALIALIIVFRNTAKVLPRLTALWGARFVVSLTEFPLSLGLDVDNPAHYASSLFFGLARSPIDFLLTSATLLVSVLIVGRSVGTREGSSRSALLSSVISSGAALAILASTNEVIFDAWLNSSLALSAMSVLPLDAPRFVLQLGLVSLFLAAVLAATVLHRLAPVRSLVDVLIVDGGLLAAAYVAARHFGLVDHVVLAVPPFLVARVLSLSRNPMEKRWSTSGLYDRLSTIGLAGVATVISFYPAVARFEERTVRDFIETTVTPIVRQHGDSRLYALAETAQTIDQMIEAGQLEDLGREDLTFQIWASTDLIASSLSSSIEIVNDDGELVSRFGLTLPPPPTTASKPPAPSEWILEEETLETDPNHPGVLLGRRTVIGRDGRRWEIRVRVAADWRNLPFISTTDPYLYLFRSAGVDAPGRFPYRELSLFVLEPNGTPVFQSTGSVLQPDEEILEVARREPMWWTYPRNGEQHEAYLFTDGTHTFVLSYATKGPLTYAAELAAWALLTAGLMLLVLAIALVLGALGARGGVSPRKLWAGIGTSFYGKLYVSFVLIALIPIASLAFLIRGIFIQQLERDVEQEGMARAQVVERFVHDLLRDRAPSGDATTRAATVTDAVLEWVGNLAAVDVDLYLGGELVATSKPELFGSGLLRSRVEASAFRDIVLERLTHSIHRESVGSFEYIVVSVPITFDPEPEPGILSLPLASQKPRIDRRVSTVNQTLLLVALGFSLAAVALAYSLARRIAGPINTLTDATHRVAEGDLDVSLPTTSEDEIGDLVRSFTQMAEDLKRQRSDLERTKKLEAWAEMARQVAHEVKNPLTPIQLAAEHLLRVHKDPDVDFDKVLDECTETILQQVKSLRQISMEFSTFASPEALNTETTDIEALVRETIAPYVQAPPEGIAVKLVIANDLPQLQVDRRLLKRTLLNLVENALHAMNGDGTVRVDVSLRNVNGTRYVELSVADTGTGIDPELQTRIFEPYFSTRAAGTGLGLAIAKKVAEEHRGTIELESSRGQGTVVRLRLPIGSHEG